MSIDIAYDRVAQRHHLPITLDTPLGIEQLPTPALVLDKPTLLRNIAHMAKHLEHHGKGFRPHAKTHKCAEIAKLQLQAGAVGICVAKISEAIAMISAGVDKLLITSPITTRPKAQALGRLLLTGQDISIVVDSVAGLEILQATLPPSCHLGILIDLDVELGRTGTRDIEMVKKLVGAVQADQRLIFRGVQHYAGHVMHIHGHAPRAEKSLALWHQVVAMLGELKAHDIDPEIVTGAGSGTYDIDVDVAELTDLQVGSYIFMDEEYRQIGSSSGDRFVDFEVSLTVACTTISEPSKKAITVDGGYKAFASDTVAPVCDDQPQARFKFAGDEHGVLIKPEGEQYLRLGQVLRFVTPHCDPTVNLHDYYWVLEEDGLVHSCWPINARGCSW